jgi:hypothetical protein
MSLAWNVLWPLTATNQRSVQERRFKATSNVGFYFVVSRVSCHLKCFKMVNETTHKMNDFILEFHNIKFYFVSLVIYVMK